MQNIAILGSTGSIGKQALDVVAAHPERFAITALVAHQNDQLIEEQAKQCNPKLIVLVDENAAGRLAKRYRGSAQIISGEQGIMEAVTHPEVQTVLTSLVGFAGLKPTLAAIAAKKNIALANKETLVAAGELVIAEAKKYNVAILPVDSEHSALQQCLQGENKAAVRRLLLTASGGPFRGFHSDQLANVTIADCLRHPNWSMGRKITVDSATLINKGLEVIEAKWLFDLEYDSIEVVVHPQSIIHSMVEFVDGAVMAQLGQPDMRVPIQYALAYPERLPSKFPRLDFCQLQSLTFEKPDMLNFPGLALAYQAGRRGGTLPCVLNAANEVAVHAFLDGKLKFLAIPKLIAMVMDNHDVKAQPNLEQIYAADQWARQTAVRIMNEALDKN